MVQLWKKIGVQLFAIPERVRLLPVSYVYVALLSSTNCRHLWLQQHTRSSESDKSGLFYGIGKCCGKMFVSRPPQSPLDTISTLAEQADLARERELHLSTARALQIPKYGHFKTESTLFRALSLRHLTFLSFCYLSPRGDWNRPRASQFLKFLCFANCWTVIMLFLWISGN